MVASGGARAHHALRTPRRRVQSVAMAATFSGVAAKLCATARARRRKRATEGVCASAAALSERPRSGSARGVHEQDLFPAQPQPLPADRRDGQPPGSRQQFPHQGGSLKRLLEGVQDEPPPIPRVLGEEFRQRDRTCVVDAERLGDRRRGTRCIVDGSEVDRPGAVRTRLTHRLGHCQGEAGLADTPAGGAARCSRPGS